RRTNDEPIFVPSPLVGEGVRQAKRRRTEGGCRPMISPTPEDEDALEKTKAPLLDHLIELRGRLIKSVVAFFLCFLLCYFFARPIFAFLVQPLQNAFGNQPGRHLIFTALYETFFTYVKIGMFGGLCLAFPYMASQLWMFVAPGLYKHERRAFLPFL